MIGKKKKFFVCIKNIIFYSEYIEELLIFLFKALSVVGIYVWELLVQLCVDFFNRLKLILLLRWRMGIKTGELVSFVFGFFNLDMIVLEYLKVFLEIN